VNISPQFFLSSNKLDRRRYEFIFSDLPLKLQEGYVGSKKVSYLESIENTAKPCRSCFQRQSNFLHSVSNWQTENRIKK